MFTLKSILKKSKPLTKDEIKRVKNRRTIDKASALELKKVETAVNKRNRSEINTLVSNWMNTFGNLKDFNREKNGFTLEDVKVHDYGLSAKVYAPWGMDLNDLDKRSPMIETGCKCKFLYKIPAHNQFAKVKFIYPNQVKINSWPLVAVKVKPWEFCPGYSIDGEPIIFNLNDTPHILIAGQQRRGKNGAADHAIASWIASCDETEIMFYMLQGAKNDLEKYKNCKQVYCYAATLESILRALEHLDKEMKRRTNLFGPMVVQADGNDNIAHYNKQHASNKLPYIIVVIDEFIELMYESGVDDPDTKKIKNKIMKHIRLIGQIGGSMGVNYMPLHQKPSAVLMPSFLKNMASVRICFGFDDLVCAEIVLGPGLAKNAFKLPHWRAFYSDNETDGFMYTPNMSTGVKKLIAPSIKFNHRTLFSDLRKSEPQEIKLVEATILKKGTPSEPPKEIKDSGTIILPIKDKKPVKVAPAPEINYKLLKTRDDMLKKSMEKSDWVPYVPPKK